MSHEPVTAYLSLGSNLGDRLEHLRAGLQALCGKGISLRSTSSIYETEPVGPVAQDWFLNCVAEVSTTLAPIELLHALQSIERAEGRERHVDKYVPQGPRTLDIDIVLYDDEVMSTPELTIPHSRMLERRFVLQALAELSPQLRIPETSLTVEGALALLADRPTVRRTELHW
jgi:2-amino-4-hydroxy-6-hydroxymethyldihydropteridine diphosphokinase